MTLETLLDWLTVENLREIIQEYRSFGPIIGFLLPILEAFLPFLPLVAFVVANANAYGVLFGILLSWAGTVTGAMLVFLLIRRFGDRKFLAFLRNQKQVNKLTNWVERHGFGPLFLLLCFPFTPSAVVNVVAGLSRISIMQYMLAVITGKLVMISTISFIGADLVSLIREPVKTAIVLGVIVVLWIVGKRVEARINKKMERDIMIHDTQNHKRSSAGNERLENEWNRGKKKASNGSKH
ncbi:TVP38/TMEM64 family protein [Jeotgalibacillus sp. R-1-5s-1]|uniref:TVP38/TMEM64 family protein n=1 Tax=Jeotgalibacillus sp. R-1-5s-1 TaxID=2555897 RepID=UPI00106B12CE|nr:TVP38/TMEM64 family protein [Jeotgalibacillus sp. R-1-5s-1]TFD97635.1 TVP38/TMEM64 family protein [Jeotgalibacillus sp. R-1-5s-1]